MKTGYIKESGYGLVGSAQRDGRRLVLVVAGLKSLAERKAEARKLLDWGFRQFRMVEPFAAGEKVGRARVWGGTQAFVDLAIREPVRVMLSPMEQKRASAEVSYLGPLRAPIAQGAEVAKLRVKVDGAMIFEAPVYAAARVDETPEMWRKAMDSLLIWSFGG